MAGLGEAASVVAVIKISQEILTLCSKYCSTVRHAEKDIKRLCDEITALHDVLKNVKKLVEDPKATKLRGSKPPAEQLEHCLCELNDLKNRLDPTQARKTRWRLIPGALKWPFTKEDVEKEVTTLNRYKATFNLALTADQT